MNNQIDEAVSVLKKGGIIIFPTDTAFGIGCRVDDERAIKRLFEIRKRPLDKATPVLISSLGMAKEYVIKIPEDVSNKLLNKYWPGALTIVLDCQKDKIPSLVRGGGDTIGLRMPNHPLALEIIKKVGVGILGPSANFSGEQTPFEYKDLNKNLLKLVDYVVEGECFIKHASTVIDCSINPWKILRNGAEEVKI